MDKFTKRKLWSDLLTSLKKETITIIIGPRQVGKTTLLFFLKDYLKETKIKEEVIFYLGELKGVILQNSHKT